LQSLGRKGFRLLSKAFALAEYLPPFEDRDGFPQAGIMERIGVNHGLNIRCAVSPDQPETATAGAIGGKERPGAGAVAAGLKESQMRGHVSLPQFLFAGVVFEKHDVEHKSLLWLVTWATIARGKSAVKAINLHFTNAELPP